MTGYGDCQCGMIIIKTTKVKLLMLIMMVEDGEEQLQQQNFWKILLTKKFLGLILISQVRQLQMI